jgi:hypothetical protein
MASASARYRYILPVVMLIVVPGCRSPDPPQVRVLDLLRELDRAEKRPPAGVGLASHVAAGIARPAVVMPVPGRVTWSFPLPRRGLFRASLALDGAADSAASVRFRLGVSDRHIYEGLGDRTLTAGQQGWIDFSSSLSAYAGFQWSIFYRPDRITWNVVLAADHAGGGAVRAVWGAPEIVTDHRAAKEYVARRQRLR